jgi:hypothetical protein
MWAIAGARYVSLLMTHGQIIPSMHDDAGRATYSASTVRDVPVKDRNEFHTSEDYAMHCARRYTKRIEHHNRTKIMKGH